MRAWIETDDVAWAGKAPTGPCAMTMPVDAGPRLNRAARTAEARGASKL